MSKYLFDKYSKEANEAVMSLSDLMVARLQQNEHYIDWRKLNKRALLNNRQFSKSYGNLSNLSNKKK